MGRADERVMESGTEVAKLGGKPEFMIGGRYKFHDPSMNGEDFITLMFGMTLPFFQRDNRYGPAIQEMSLKREGARLDTEGILNASRFTVSETYRSAAKNLRVYGLVKDGLLIQARQAYESTLAAYGVGKADFASLLMALNEMYDAHGDIIMAKADYQEAVAMIAAALGRDGLKASPSVYKGQR
jgi:outer membrane protein TolC